jgi:hypothetical protein
MSYTYRQTEPELWTVGSYTPSGKFDPESDHGSWQAAAERVAFLNGGVPTPPQTPDPAPSVEIHPATAQLLCHFDYAHLPARLRLVSRPFGDLARLMASSYTGPEITVCLRKLLEAKDCAVRAALGPMSTEQASAVTR